MATTRIVFAATALAVSVLLAEPLAASDGRLEINQACAAVGCFPGDNPGLPIEITAAGSYILTGSLNQTSPNGNGVRIQADDVTLDLNGFSIVGSGTDAGRGIDIRANRAEVRNGRILDFGGGVVVDNTATQGRDSRFAALTVNTTGTEGIRLGYNGVVADCIVSSTGWGVIVGQGSRVVGNVIAQAGTAENHLAINATNGEAIIHDNFVRQAGAVGILANSSIITSNYVMGSGDSGIAAGGDGSVIAGNTVRANQNYGIEVSGTDPDLLIRGNNVYGNNLSGGGFTNIEACPSCTLIDNHAP